MDRWIALNNTIFSSGPANIHLNKEESPSFDDVEAPKLAGGDSISPRAYCWKILVSILGFTNLILLTEFFVALHVSHFPRNGTYEGGFGIELVRPLDGLVSREKMFSGGLVYNESKQLMIDHGPDDDIWVGEPDVQMDELWQKVEDGEPVFLLL